MLPSQITLNWRVSIQTCGSFDLLGDKYHICSLTLGPLVAITSHQPYIKFCIWFDAKLFDQQQKLRFLSLWRRKHCTLHNTLQKKPTKVLQIKIPLSKVLHQNKKNRRIQRWNFSLSPSPSALHFCATFTLSPHFHAGLLLTIDIVTTASRQVAIGWLIYNCCNLQQIIVQHVIMQPLFSKTIEMHISSPGLNLDYATVNQ